MSGIPEYGTGQHEDYLRHQEERADVARDHQAEQDNAEFIGWWDAQGFTSSEFEQPEMAEAFIAGMQAERDLAAAAPAPAGAPGALEVAYLYHWRFDRGEEFGLYWHGADADAKAAEHAGEGLSEVLSMAILGDRPAQQPQAAPGADAATVAEARAATDLRVASIIAERNQLRIALERIASYAAGTATKAMIGLTARRALDNLADAPQSQAGHDLAAAMATLAGELEVKTAQTWPSRADIAKRIRRALGTTHREPARELAAVASGDRIRIVPDRGPERIMRVAHVEHRIITLADLPDSEQPPKGQQP